MRYFGSGSQRYATLLSAVKRHWGPLCKRRLLGRVVSLAASWRCSSGMGGLLHGAEHSAYASADWYGCCLIIHDGTVATEEADCVAEAILHCQAHVTILSLNCGCPRGLPDLVAPECSSPSRDDWELSDRQVTDREQGCTPKRPRQGCKRWN